MTIKIYVEGGGDHNKAFETQCRHGFSEFFRKAGLEGRMPRVVACGGRRQAYDSFRTAHDNAGPDETPILLVDSEAPVAQSNPWEHVRLRPGDGWQRPRNAEQDQIHFMVQAMEAWFHADKDSLARYFGQGFHRASLSQRSDIESIPKDDLLDGLRQATRHCRNGEYAKGRDSFPILALIDPEKVQSAPSPHAQRLMRVLDRICRP